MTNFLVLSSDVTTLTSHHKRNEWLNIQWYMYEALASGSSSRQTCIILYVVYIYVALSLYDKSMHGKREPARAYA